MGIIKALETLPAESLSRWLVAATCVLSIQQECEPKELLENLYCSFDENWSEIRQAILLRQFEDQMSEGGEMLPSLS